MQIIRQILGNSVLVQKIAFLFLGLILFRILASIPTPLFRPELFLDSFTSGNQLLQVFNLFSGGGLSNLSIVMLGVFPYITVSIISQLLTVAVPRLHSLYHEEGEEGRKKLGQYTRIATVPVAALNAIGFLVYFSGQGAFNGISTIGFVAGVFVITAGTILLMWIGELITEFGVGNGISLLVFAAIIITIPSLFINFISNFSIAELPQYIFIAIGVFILFMVSVWMNEAYRPIPVVYARHGASRIQKHETYLPIKINPTGVLPLIFSITILVFLQFLGRLGQLSETSWIQGSSENLSIFLGNPVFFAISVFFLTVFFTYFHTPIVVDVKRMATNLQKQGAYIPGIRPGEETRAYLSTILTRIIGYSSVFLGSIAALPFLVGGSTSTFSLAIGGAGILIMVSVVLDIRGKILSRLVV